MRLVHHECWIKRESEQIDGADPWSVCTCVKLWGREEAAFWYRLQSNSHLVCFHYVQVRRKVKTEESPRLRPSDLRNFITMFVVFVLFAICWAPLNLIGLAVAIDPPRVAPRIPEWLFVVSYFMAYFNSCLNAIIYGLLNRNFRNEYKRIVTSVWVTRLFVTETSRAATDGRSMKSKQSPPPPHNNNESVRDRANKEWKVDHRVC